MKEDVSARLQDFLENEGRRIFLRYRCLSRTLMALALEKQKTSDGKPKFQPNNILNWLEGIRQEAEIQRFGK